MYEIFKFCYGEKGQFQWMTSTLKSIGERPRSINTNRAYRPRVVVFDQENSAVEYFTEKLFNHAYNGDKKTEVFMSVYEDNGKETADTISLEQYAVAIISYLGN
jgi:hypothetical protein